MNNKTKIDIAWYLFRSGLDEPTRMGETCGAVTGAFMVIGVKYGKQELKMKWQKKKLVTTLCPKLVQDAAEIIEQILV